MKGDNQIEKFGELFARMKQQEPLLSDEDVRTIIARTPGGSSQRTVKRKNPSNLLKYFVSGSLITGILVGLVMFSSPKNNEIINETSSLLPSTMDSLTVEHGKIQKIANNPIIENKATFFYRGPTVAENTKVQENEDPCSNSPGKFFGDDYIVYLSEDEFSKLGFTIKFAEPDEFSKYVFFMEEWYYYNQSPDSIVAGFGVLRTDNRNYLVNPTAADLAMHGKPYTQNDFYPVCLTNRYNQPLINVISQYASYFRFCYTQNEDWSKKPQKKRGINGRDSLEKKIGVILFKKLFLDVTNFESANDTLVPVVLKPYDNQRFWYGITTLRDNDFAEKIFWFKPSKAFYKKLPLRYSAPVEHFYENVKALKKRLPCRQTDLVNYSSIDQLSKNISEIPKLTLTPEELSRIGIKIYKDSIIYYAHQFGFKFFDNRFLGRVGGNRICDTCEHDPPLNFISNFTGERPIRSVNLQGNKTSDFAFLENINRLIAVKIDHTLCESCFKEDLIFWFAPTDRFLNGLPARYADDIRKEYKSLLIHSDPNIPQIIKDNTPAVCTYFEECRPTYPQITNLKVYPNPAMDKVNVDFELDKPDKIRVVIFDIEGRPVQILKNMENFETGPHHLEVDLSWVSSGIYILTLQNNIGNFKTQRIIKQ